MTSSSDPHGAPPLRKRSLLHSAAGTDDDDLAFFYNDNSKNTESKTVLFAGGVATYDHSNVHQLGLPPENPGVHRTVENGSLGEFLAAMAVWLLVVVCAVYHVVTERQRRRHSRRPQRLEYLTPSQRHQRRLGLAKSLARTTMVVTVQHLIRQEQEESIDDGTTITMKSTTEEEQRQDSPCHYCIQVREEFEEEKGSVDSGMISCNDENTDLTTNVGMKENYENEHPDNGNDDDEVDPYRLSAMDSSHDTNDNDSVVSDNDEQDLLLIPVAESGTRYRTVASTCAICLRRYHVHDQVTWSPQYPDCSHAFHQPCLVEWLAKLPDCNCPCCRKVFCTVEETEKPSPTLNNDVNTDNQWEAFFASGR